eukprot:CAMPEP_0168622076 /NCGR_PEP_ID=MMETSP0449_2-20121227/8058_1 /TAXON_ID=1082188 /ORGANISM="Strombidium rassoulzadegani, Strain ras09" /LENGTH=163 /DNA_ID=CAMNT_0008663285 /DNA_START=127 /DNA_END=619 /DNA_ORIENTATION=-
MPHTRRGDRSTTSPSRVLAVFLGLSRVSPDPLLLLRVEEAVAHQGLGAWHIHVYQIVSELHEDAIGRLQFYLAVENLTFTRPEYEQLQLNVDLDAAMLINNDLVAVLALISLGLVQRNLSASLDLDALAHPRDEFAAVPPHHLKYNAVLLLGHLDLSPLSCLV